MAASPSEARSTAYACSRSPFASTFAAFGSSSTRSTRMALVTKVRRAASRLVTRGFEAKLRYDHSGDSSITPRPRFIFGSSSDDYTVGPDHGLAKADPTYKRRSG